MFMHRLQEANESDNQIFVENAKKPKLIITGSSQLVSQTLINLTNRLGSSRFLLKPLLPEEIVGVVQEQIQNAN